MNTRLALSLSLCVVALFSSGCVRKSELDAASRESDHLARELEQERRAHLATQAENQQLRLKLENNKREPLIKVLRRLSSSTAIGVTSNDINDILKSLIEAADEVSPYLNEEDIDALDTIKSYLALSQSLRTRKLYSPIEYLLGKEGLNDDQRRRLSLDDNLIRLTDEDIKMLSRLGELGKTEDASKKYLPGTYLVGAVAIERCLSKAESTAQELKKSLQARVP